VENKTSLTPEEIALFAKLSAQDIVARSKPIPLGMVTTIFKYVKAKPHKRHRILADRPAKWHQENKWLANWLYNLFNGKFTHISKPIDDEIARERIRKRVIDSILSFLHGRTNTRMNKGQLSSNSSSSSSSINHEKDMEKIDELYDALASEMNHISLLKVSAILTKHSKRNKNIIKGNRSRKVDAIILNGNFRKELYDHLGVQMALIFPVLDFLGVQIPEGLKAESNKHYYSSTSRRKELEDAIAFVCTQAPFWVTDEGVNTLKNSYNLSASLVVDIKKSHYDTIIESATKLFVEQQERDRLLKARKNPFKELADKAAYALEVKKLASGDPDCIHTVSIRSSSFGGIGESNDANSSLFEDSEKGYEVEYEDEYEDKDRVKKQLMSSRFMPWNYSHSMTRMEEGAVADEDVFEEVESKHLSSGINSHDDQDNSDDENDDENDNENDDENDDENNTFDEDMKMEQTQAVENIQKEISEPVMVDMQHSKNKIMLRNLPDGVTFAEIQDAFINFASLEPSDCYIIRDRNSLEEQKEALIQLNEQENSILALLHDVGFENEKEANLANKREKDEKMVEDDVDNSNESERESKEERHENDSKLVTDASEEIKRKRAKRELASLRGERKKWLNKAMYLAKSEKSDTIAFLTFKDTVVYEKALRDDMRIFGVSMTDPITGLSRLARSEDAQNKNELFIEICRGDEPNPGQLRLEHITLKLEEILGVDFTLYYNHGINHLRPCFLHLQFDTHEDAWNAFEKLEDSRINTVERYDDMYNITNTPSDNEDNTPLSQSNDNEENSRLLLVPHWIQSSRYLLTKKEFQLQKVSQVDRALLEMNTARRPYNRYVDVDDAVNGSNSTTTEKIYSFDDTSLGAKINKSIKNSLNSFQYSDK